MPALVAPLHAITVDLSRSVSAGGTPGRTSGAPPTTPVEWLCVFVRGEAWHRTFGGGRTRVVEVTLTTGWPADAGDQEMERQRVEAAAAVLAEHGIDTDTDVLHGGDTAISAGVRRAGRRCRHRGDQRPVARRPLALVLDDETTRPTVTRPSARDPHRPSGY